MTHARDGTLPALFFGTFRDESAAVAAYHLHLQSGPNAGERYPLTKERTVIGRHPSCDVMIAESAVSRQHAAVVIDTATDDGAMVVEDLGSRNGTLLNGRAITAPEPLRVGDEISVGGQCLVLIREGGAAASADTDATMFVDLDEAPYVVSRVNLTGEQPTGGDPNAAAKLRAVKELGQAIGDALEPDDVPPRLLDGLFTIFPGAERAFVLLLDRESGKPVLRGRKLRSAPEPGPLMLSRSLIEKVVRDRHAILSNDAVGDSRLNMTESILNCQIRSVMCAPIGHADGEVIGVLQVDSREMRNGFAPDDLEVLASLAGLAARAFEQSMAHEETVRREKLRRDLDLARQVQQGLLPKHPPVLPGYDVFDFYAPAQQVGGDYYDYVPLRDGRLVIVMADVSGKGVSAALIMATLSSKAALALATEPDVAVAVTRINEGFCLQGWEERFVTVMVCVIDPSTHRATLVNAGHLPLALRRADGTVELVGADLGCLPLGWDPHFTYRSCSFDIEPGSTFVLYTDGISEAMDFESRLYDIDRLAATLAAASGSAEDVGRRILTDVERFTAGQVQTDDMCLICVHRQA
jgi:sigma-B regulation protein RsbU (phosphoserine phosphatase)